MREMVKYVAPEGMVYDYLNPPISVIDGEEFEEHLYCKFLILCSNDSIDRYVLVKDPKEDK